MLSVVASLALMASMSALGVALLWRFARHLDPLERIAYGAPLGMVVSSIALVPIATLVGFRVEVILVLGFGSLLAATVIRYGTSVFSEGLTAEVGGSLAALRERPAGDRSIGSLVRRISLLPTVVIGAFALRWLFYWRDALTYQANGLFAGHVNIWGDWPVHLGIVSSFAYGNNFPPTHPRFDGHAFAYHYLSDLTAAAFVPLGMDPAGALALHSYVLCVLVAIGLYAFARRMTRSQRAAALTVVLFLLGGGLGWVVTAAAIDHTHDIVGTLAKAALDRQATTALHIRFVNMFFGFLSSQRGYLYGLPLAFAIVSTLLVAVRRANVRLFVVAGVIAGLLPLAHLGTLLALAIVTPVLFVLFPSRAWLAFFAAWGLVAMPQLLTQLGGGAGALAAIRVQLGWVAAPDPWPWFWLKNLGWFIPLLAVGLLARRLLPERARRFLWAFMALFVAANVVVFQPWDWDNHKLLVYWFLAVAIVVAALLSRTWQHRPDVGSRVLVVGVVITMTLSGVLEDAGTLLGQSRYQMLGADELALAAQVRARTAPDALFVVGMENHDPIAMLTGRRIYVGYANWLWTEGIDYAPRTAEVKRIYRAEPRTESLLAQRGIDYVVIGPHERDQLGADEAAFRQRYPVLVTVGRWTVYDVRGAVP
jgi:hypothetical protein